MAEDVRRIVAEFTARNRAAGQFAAFRRDLDTTSRTIRRMATGILALAGIGGIGYMIKQQMIAIDTTAKLSDRLGLTTEALIGLQHGSRISGVETETLNKSLEIFSRRLGEVGMGTGEAKRALESLGLSADELVGLNMDKAIGIVADQIRRLSTQSEKAAAANYLFGRSGQQLLNLFEEGSKGIEEYRKETEKLGLAFNRIDAAKVEAANDALTRTRAVFTGLFRQATIQLAPYIEAAANAFVDFATRGEGVGANFINLLENMTLGISHVISETESLVISLGKLSSPLENLKKISEANQRAIEQYRKVTGDVKAFTYPGGPFALPVQPKDVQMWNIILKKQQEFAGLVPKERTSQIVEAFVKIRKDAEERAAEAVKRIPRPALELEKAEELSQAEKLIASMQRENELLMMSSTERAKTLAIDKYREAVQKDIKAGMQRGIELTITERQMVEKLAEEHLRLSEKTKDSTFDVAAAYSRMYDEIDEKTLESFEVKRQLLDAEYEKYAQVIKDKVTLDRWLADQQTKLAIQQAKDLGGPLEGIGAAFEEMRREMGGLGQLFYDLTKTGVQGLVDSLGDAVFEARNFNEAIEQVGQSLARMAFEYYAKQAIVGLGTALFPFPVAHSGGIAGVTSFPKRMVSPAIFAEAPRLHSGLRSNEFPAILEKYEPVGKRGFQEYINKGNFNSSGIENLLSKILSALEQRQVISAKIVDKRDVVTHQQMEGREGEQLVMHHVGRNS